MAGLAGLPEPVRRALHHEAVPDWRAPTLATLTDKRFSNAGWIFERKFDGMSALAFRDGDSVRLLSRNRQPLDRTYPELIDALLAQRTTRFVVDGEVVAFEGRRTSFARPQGRLGITDPGAARASRVRVFHYLFELLHLDGDSTTDVPLLWFVARRHRLRRSAALHPAPRCGRDRRLPGGARARRRERDRQAGRFDV